jgi:hypothetical protein
VLAKPDPAAAREAAKQKEKPAPKAKTEAPRERIETGSRAWRRILQLHQEADVTIERVDEQYRRLARERHPDNGGSEAMMVELNAARDAARKELSAKAE